MSRPFATSNASSHDTTSEIRITGAADTATSSPPLRAELRAHRCQDLDLTLSFHASCIEASAQGEVRSRIAMEAIASCVDRLGAALRELHARAAEVDVEADPPTWWRCVERTYQWAIDIAEQANDLAAATSDDGASFAASLAPLASYSRLLFYGIFESLALDAGPSLREANNVEALGSLRRVQERAWAFFRTLEIVAAGAL